jgi:hypothetical protein
MTALKAEDTGAVARTLAETAAQGKGPGVPVIIAGPEAAKKAARTLGVEVSELPA